MLTDISKILTALEAMEAEFAFPLLICMDSDARGALQKQKQKFLRFLNDNNIVDTLELKCISDTFEKINDSWIDFLKGKMQTAISKISNLLDLRLPRSERLHDYLSISLTLDHLNDAGKTSLYGFYAENLQRLFRARLGNTVEFEKKQMLHIPFDQRQLVGNQRYSISGFPCIYLGGSAYTCWLEMNKPNLDSFYLSRLQLVTSLKYLDLSLLPRQTRYLVHLVQRNDHWGNSDQKDEITRDLFSRCIYSFPLVSACSILNENAYDQYKFRSDYVIPQLVMLALANRKSDIKAVKFISNKVIGRAMPDTEFSLVVIPNQDKITDQISAQLCKQFAITQPVNARLLLDMISGNEMDAREFHKAKREALYLPYLAEQNMYDGIRNNALNIEVVKINGSFSEYRSTPLGKIERVLINSGGSLLLPN